jgi:hypothetical protein
MRPIVLKLSVVLLVCGAAGLTSGCYLTTSSNSQLTQQELEHELSSLTPPSSAVRTAHHSIFKSDHGNLADDYKSGLKYNELRAYYDAELAKRGWLFKKESPLLSWGANHGEIMAFYCKGQTSAELYYTGQEGSRLGYTYSFGLSWGIYACK